ncbi:MAG TPA: hypothetical protein VHU92_30450 [Streptosporangiaceae bacterium]|nr:hypothetical protein [Streptosporangiaceae bacterium]
MRYRAQFSLYRRGILAVAATTGLVLGTSVGVAQARPASAPGTWHKAINVPGLAALHSTQSSGIDPVSCGAAGDCLAGGGLSSGSPFLVSQVRSKWGRAQLVRGLAGLNTGHNAGIASVSCTSPGNCTIGGGYEDKSHHGHAWVASQVRGKWGRAHQLPGMAALNKGNGSGVGSISCVSIGNCSADGSYTNAKGKAQPFVVSEVKGTWHDVQAVAGVAALATYGTAGIGALSCRSAGDCSAAGNYRVGKDTQDGFVVSEVHGQWGQAEPIPGLTALNTGGYASVNSLACGAPGDCLAGGTYNDPQGDRLTFVASQVNGTWGNAQQLPGMTALAQFGDGEVDTVACASAGNCIAGGIAGVDNGYDVNGGGQAFVASQTSGTWGKAEVIPGTARLNSGADGGTVTLSCPRAGACTAAGYYGVGQNDNKVYNLELFVDSQNAGKWGKAEEIPGTGALNSGQWAFMGQVSCPAQDQCSATGVYANKKNDQYPHAFLVSQSPS